MGFRKLVFFFTFVTSGLVLHAGLSWQFNYLDSGVGFSDPVHGAVRRAALNQAASEISDIFVHYTTTLEIDMDGSLTGFSKASAGPYSNSVSFAPGFENRGDPMTKILGGYPAPAAPDGGADGILTRMIGNWQMIISRGNLILSLQ